MGHSELFVYIVKSFNLVRFRNDLYMYTLTESLLLVRCIQTWYVTSAV